MDILDIVITSNSKHVYIIDGKEWIVGEQKISKWSKAKCNNDVEKNDIEKNDVEKNDVEKNLRS